MSLQELALGLPRAEKLRLMEALWSDLSVNETEEFDSPAWHAAALSETEQRVASGAEISMDWDDAKRQLREA